MSQLSTNGNSHFEKEKWGKLIIVTGCMFSGKTEFSLQRVTECFRKKKKPVIIRNLRDNRSSGDDKRMKTHDGYVIGIEVDQIWKNDLDTTILKTELKDYHLIAIDEGQFFDKKTKEGIFNLLIFAMETIKLGKDCVINGLALDRNQRPWASIQAVLPYADKIEFKHGTCRICGGKATCSREIPESEKNDDGNQLSMSMSITRSSSLNEDENYIKVGTDNDYASLCKSCFFEKEGYIYSKKAD